MEWILHRTGITTSWLVEKLGYGVGTLEYAINERGLTCQEVENIQRILNSAGHQMKNFKWSSNALEDINFLRKNYGIKKTV